MTRERTKPTARQQRRNDFLDAVYDTLRRYQRGEYNATSGTVAGALDVPLTVVLDSVAAIADRIYGVRK